MDKQWEDAVIRAAAEASRLQPLASALLVASVFVLLGGTIAEPMSWIGQSDIDRGEATRQVARNLIEAAPGIALIWGLFETRSYLRRLARGEVWGPATMQLLGRVGDALVAAAVLAMFVAPTISEWVEGSFGLRADWNAGYLALAGLGLMLTLISRVVRNVVEVAAALKRESDEIV